MNVADVLHRYRMLRRVTYDMGIKLRCELRCKDCSKIFQCWNRDFREVVLKDGQCLGHENGNVIK